jgi:hypothetical protein
MTRKDIVAGMRIRDEVFGANPYAQLSLIRKSLWALNVLRKEDSTPENKAIAEQVLEMAEQIDNSIDGILRQEYPEEYQ